MGSCCSTENNHGNKLSTDLTTFTSAEIDPKILAAIIKAQACFRGLITRKKISDIYGFKYKSMISMNKKNIVELDPEKLEEQKNRVQQIRMSLGDFKFDQKIDNDPEVHLE